MATRKHRFINRVHVQEIFQGMMANVDIILLTLTDHVTGTTPSYFD